MTHAPPAGDRGAGVLAYLSLGVLAAVILAGLVTLGIGDRFSAGAAAVVCRTVQDRGDCAAPAGDDRPSTGATGREHGEKHGEKHAGKKDGGCHGFLGCTWSGAKHVGGGVWGGVKDTGGGIRSVFTTNPLTTAKGLGTFLWNETPPGQVVRAWKACGAGHYAECADAGACAVVAGGCLVRDLVVDDKTRDDLEKHRWGDAAGRVIWNGGSLLIPTKIPGLSRLGKAGKAGEDAGDAAKGARRSPPGRGGENSSAYRGAERELRDARKTRGTTGHLTYPVVKDLAARFHDLGPAERTRFLGELAPSELADIWNAAPGIDVNLRSDLLAAAPEDAVARLDARPAFPDSGGWYTFDGDLWRDTGPTRWDVEQGVVGDCWCMAPEEAVAEQAPARIKKLIHQNPNGTYTVTFGDGRRVTVTPELPRNGAHVYKEAGWPAVLEKAIAERYGGYHVLNRGGAEDEILHQLLGGDTDFFTWSAHTMPDTATIAGYLKDHDALVLGIDDPKLPAGAADGIVKFHDYAVIGADPLAKTITIANPHGPSAPEIVLDERDFRSLRGFSLARGVTRE